MVVQKITDNVQDRLFITNDNGEREAIGNCSPESGQLALGLAFSPTSNPKDEIKRLKGKIEIWAEHVRTGYLQRQEAWHCLQTTIMKTIDYSLLASILSQQEFKDVMKPVLQVGLPKSGICRTLSRAVVHASIKYQGLGVPNPFWMQGIYKILTLMEPKRNNLTNRLIQLSMGNLITESGLGPTVMEYDFHRSKHLVTLGWLTSIWEVLHDFPNISIRPALNYAHQRPLRFSGDRYIMQMLLTNTDISGNDLRLFNICRIYNQAELISDIITADGKNIRRQLWNGCHHQVDVDERFGKISQPRPSEKAWKTWRQVLQALFNTTQNGKLYIALPGIQDTSDWKWYYDEQCTRLYQRTSLGINELSVHQTGSSQRT
jgi:hypothetical protein